jgi:anti-sigma B factor antagonist
MSAPRIIHPIRRHRGENVSRLRVQAVVCEELRTLRLAGELDLACRAMLEDAIARIVSDDCTLVLDLRAVTFMDTTGVHVALGAVDLCASQGCELRLLPGPARVQRVFELVDALERLPFTSAEHAQL